MGDVYGHGPELLSPGTPAPRFDINRADKHRFYFDSLAGRHVVLGFLGRVGDSAVTAAVRAMRDNLRLFDGTNMVLYWVNPDPKVAAAHDLQPEGARIGVLSDYNLEITRLFTLASADGGYSPAWVVLDPRLRVVKSLPLSEAKALFDFLKALPPAEEADGDIGAPVLTVPRVFEPDFCRRLIDYHSANGATDSGFMRQFGESEVHVVDHALKRRSDVLVTDPDLRTAIQSRIGARLLPEIDRAFSFQVTRMERDLIACYDAEGGGYFRPHRDNTSPATVHRRFAVTINLNAEDYEGGDLHFPEFGKRLYRAPTGGAVVFACALLHEAMPVTAGRRYAFLPFLYDEEGERARQQNLHRLAADTLKVER